MGDERSACVRAAASLRRELEPETDELRQNYSHAVRERRAAAHVSTVMFGHLEAIVGNVLSDGRVERGFPTASTACLRKFGNECLVADCFLRQRVSNRPAPRRY